MLKDFSKAILVLDKNECGATLTWKHFFPNTPLHKLLIEVRRRDIGLDEYYEEKIRGSEVINEGLSNFRHQFKDRDKLELLKELGDILLNDSAEFIEKLKLTGEKSLLERDIIIVNAISEDRVVLRQLDEFTVPFVSLTKQESRYNSMIGNKLARQYRDCPFAWVETADGLHHLRSTGFDVAEVARRHGGDGQVPAAGFEVY